MALAPPRAALLVQEGGLPLQRPWRWALHDRFLLGPDLLMAPVQRAGAEQRGVCLPAGADWAHAWSGRQAAGRGLFARAEARLDPLVG